MEIIRSPQLKKGLFALVFCLLAGALFAQVPYTEEGYASWYGGEFHGRRTANGEIFDTMQMTAAHKTLPFGTIVTVTDLDSGRTVQVRINDRGPFVVGRSIDLSRAAAEKLGMIGNGVAHVRLDAVLPDDANVPPPVQPVAVTVPSTMAVTSASSIPGAVAGASLQSADDSVQISPLPGTELRSSATLSAVDPQTRTIQIASFSDPDNAESLMDFLRRNGLSPVQESTADPVPARVLLRDVPVESVDSVLISLKNLGYSQVLVRMQ